MGEDGGRGMGAAAAMFASPSQPPPYSTGKGKESVEKEMNPEGKSVHCNQTLAAFRKDDNTERF